MIVVDTNVIASLFIQRSDSTVCREALEKARTWVVPPLWCSELLSALRYETRLVEQAMPLAQAEAVMRSAELLFEPRERKPPAERVLALSSRRLKSYDAEFLALAEDLDVPVLSNDRDFLSISAGRGMTPEAYLAS